MSPENILIRNANPIEYIEVGQIMVKVYAGLEGFPSQVEQPNYYQMLSNIGEQTSKPGTDLLVAVTDIGSILGAVVYYSEMVHYGSGGTATKERNAGGFRFLAVKGDAKGLGIGKLLTNACIDKAKLQNKSQLIIHSTKVMKVAWKMYENLGFKSAVDLDFMQGELPVFGFRLLL